MSRRLLYVLSFVVALLAAGAASAGPNGSDEGTMCVLNTQLRAENETTGSTSTATGHAQIKVRNDGTIEWNVFILNPNAETFFAGHIHQAPAGSPGPIVLPLHMSGTTTDAEIRDTG